MWNSKVVLVCLFEDEYQTKIKEIKRRINELEEILAKAQEENDNLGQACPNTVHDFGFGHDNSWYLHWQNRLEKETCQELLREKQKAYSQQKDMEARTE